MTQAANFLRKLTSIKEGYIAVSFAPGTNELLAGLLMKVMNEASFSSMKVQPIQELHTTLMYSPDTPMLEITPFLKGKSLEFTDLAYNLFGPDEDVLVITFECAELKTLNQVYVDAGEKPSELSADYNPHITLGTKVTDLDTTTLPALPASVVVEIGNHFSEEIKE